MTKTRHRLLAIIVGLLYIPSGYGQTNAPSPTSFQPPVAKIKLWHAAPGQAVLLAPATLTPGKPAWATVESAEGKPLSGISLLVNTDIIDSNVHGQAIFRTPDKGAVSLCLKSEDGQELAHLDYALLQDGLLCLKAAWQTVGRLVPTNHAAICQLLYAPSVIQPGQTAMLMGTGFAGRPGLDRVIMDGAAAELLAGSESSILAKVPDHLALGEMKSLFVSTTCGDSDSLEVDVASPQIAWAGNVSAKQKSLDGRISLNGTSLPAVVLVTIEQPEDLHVSIDQADTSSLPAESLIVMPGGDDNFQSIKASHTSKHRAAVSAVVLPDVPELNPADGAPLASYKSAGAWQALDYALLVKLKRRCLGVEDAIHESRMLSHSLAASEKQQAQQRALSQRHIALAAMTRAREAIFAAHGATQVQLAQAIDDATGGAYYVLESQVRALYLVPETTVIKQRAAVDPASKARFLEQLPEPKFKLWPPPENAIRSQAPGPTDKHLPNQVVATPQT